MSQINSSIFRAYDIRGIYPNDINEEAAYKIAQAYSKFLGGEKPTVVIGRDVRLSGLKLQQAFTAGLCDHGINVVDIGMVPTDQMYFAVVHGKYDGGVQITASHNPAQYNGIKLVRAKAHPISGDSGIMQIRDIAASGYEYKTLEKGSVTSKSFDDEYIEKVLSIIDVKAIRHFKVVANLNFGAIGSTIATIAAKLGLKLDTINAEPNGSFPKGRPDPLIPENRTETIERVRITGADLGVAWDADADRCYFFDEKGRFLSGYFTNVILADYMLEKYPKSKVVADARQVWALQDAVATKGGELLLNLAGHSRIKERMIKEDAVYGGELSGHYYFKDFYYLDNGVIPFLLMLELLSKTSASMSQLYQPLFAKYFPTEEINSEVKDVEAVLSALKETYKDGELNELDGVSIEYPDWRFNVRAGNTEPVVRLNLEAKSAQLREEKEKEVLSIIRGQ